MAGEYVPRCAQSCERERRGRNRAGPQATSPGGVLGPCWPVYQATSIEEQVVTQSDR
jgi:hypothetical protein